MNNKILITIVIILIGAGGFFAGMKYQQSQRRNNFTQFTGGPNGSGRNGNNQFQGIRPVSGEIISADDKSITVKMRDGSSRIVILTNSTVVNKTATAQKEDLKTGEQVAVIGTQNSDNSITAQTISLNPMLGRMATEAGK